MTRSSRRMPGPRSYGSRLAKWSEFEDSEESAARVTHDLGPGIRRDERNNRAPYFFSKPALMISVTSSPTTGTYLLTPKSLRLITPLTSKPVV